MRHKLSIKEKDDIWNDRKASDRQNISNSER